MKKKIHFINNKKKKIFVHSSVLFKSKQVANQIALLTKNSSVVSLASCLFFHFFFVFYLHLFEFEMTDFELREQLKIT